MLQEQFIMQVVQAVQTTALHKEQAVQVVAVRELTQVHLEAELMQLVQQEQPIPVVVVVVVKAV
jgi:hypothetical protein